MSKPIRKPVETWSLAAHETGLPLDQLAQLHRTGCLAEQLERERNRRAKVEADFAAAGGIDPSVT